jgi:hypothetical protein
MIDKLKNGQQTIDGLKEFHEYAIKMVNMVK